MTMFSRKRNPLWGLLMALMVCVSSWHCGGPGVSNEPVSDGGESLQDGRSFDKEASEPVGRVDFGYYPDTKTPERISLPEKSVVENSGKVDRAALPDKGQPPKGPLSKFGLTKFDLLGAGKGSAFHQAICRNAGLPNGCDVCKVLGYHKDYVCDSPLNKSGLCQVPDPDCQPRKASYYVAPNGKDSNSGSLTAPFASVQKAHDMAKAGDLIYLRGGKYTPATSTVFKKAGTSSKPIVLQTYPGEKVVVDATKLPDGNIKSGSTPTWIFRGAKHWKVIGPIHLTKGRGSGLMIEKDTHFIELNMIESSYNGQRAARAGHGFLIIESQWADARDIHFINCDAHHNANHLVKPGEDAAKNRYQHGDGFRIKSGKNIRLTGCRSWNNLDDGYDLVWAKEPILLRNCWAAYTGYDDAAGSITGKRNWAAAWGEGIKLGYTSDTGQHIVVGGLSWKNVHLGYRMDGGPNQLYHCSSYKNGKRALGWDLGKKRHILRNNLDFDTLKKSTIPKSTSSSFNSWDTATKVTVGADDFVSVDDSKMLGPRAVNGALPVTSFLRLTSGSDLVNAGTKVGHFFSGKAPDLGCFQRL